MAKKKVSEVAEAFVPVVDSVAEPVEAPKSEIEEPVESAKVEVDNDQMPAHVLDYFKRHPHVDALYFDNDGGIFYKDAIKAFVEDAVLYQNPYFKH